MTSSLDKLFEIAAEQNGKTYGYYLRDSIVAKVKNPNGDPKITVKYIDVWFPTQTDIDIFIAKMENNLKLLDKGTLELEVEHAENSQHYLLLNEKGKPVTWIDIVLSNKKRNGNMYEMVNDMY